VCTTCISRMASACVDGLNVSSHTVWCGKLQATASAGGRPCIPHTHLHRVISSTEWPHVQREGVYSYCFDKWQGPCLGRRCWDECIWRASHMQSESSAGACRTGILYFVCCVQPVCLVVALIFKLVPVDGHGLWLVGFLPSHQPPVLVQSRCCWVQSPVAWCG
jgi:hypothetical protein